MKEQRRYSGIERNHWLATSKEVGMVSQMSYANQRMGLKGIFSECPYENTALDFSL